MIALGKWEKEHLIYQRQSSHISDDVSDEEGNTQMENRWSVLVVFVEPWQRPSWNIFGFYNDRSFNNLAKTNELINLLSLAVLAQASVRWPIRADRVFLKRQEQNQNISDGGGIQRCSTGQAVKSDVSLSIKACQHILVITQNKMINLKMSITVSHCCSLLYLDCLDCLWSLKSYRNPSEQHWP